MKAELHPCSPNWMVEGWSPAHATAIAATILRLWVFVLGNGVCTGMSRILNCAAGLSG